MTGSSQGSPATDALFTDALAGFDGTAAPPPAGVERQWFTDPLLAPPQDVSTRISGLLLPEAPLPDLPPIDMPQAGRPQGDMQQADVQRVEVPQPGAPQIETPRTADAPPGARQPGDPRAAAEWNDPRLRSAAATARGGTSADRARAAREAMQAKRDAALGQRPTPSSARARIESFARSGQAPMQAPQQGWPAPQGPARQGPAPQGPARQGPAPQQRPDPGGTSYPQQRTVTGRPARRNSGAGWGALVFLVLFLIFSGLGQQLLDELAHLFQQ